MKAAINILSKLFVARFYAVNTGFFLLMFLLLFGVVQGGTLISYHLSLMEFILSSPTSMLVAFTIWLLYNYKCLAFIHAVIRNPANHFLNTLQCYRKGTLLLLLAATHLLLYLPVLLYSVCVIALGVHKLLFLQSLLVACFQLALIAFSTFSVYSALLYPWQRLLPWKINTSWKLHKTFYTILLWFTYYERKRTLLLLKIVSILLLFIPLELNKDNFQVSDFALVFQISIASHAIIAYYYVQFIEVKMRWLRNTPRSPMHFFMLYAATFCIILIPETIYLLKHTFLLIQAANAFSLILFFIAQLLLYTALQYQRGMTMQEYTLQVFVICVASAFTMLLKQFALIGAIELVVALSLFRELYPTYEKNNNL